MLVQQLAVSPQRKHPSRQAQVVPPQANQTITTIRVNRTNLRTQASPAIRTNPVTHLTQAAPMIHPTQTAPMIHPTPTTQTTPIVQTILPMDATRGKFRPAMDTASRIPILIGLETENATTGSTAQKRDGTAVTVLRLKADIRLSKRLLIGVE